MTLKHHKKVILAGHTKRTKWAPFWAVVRKFGKGKRVHPSEITKHRRHWRQVKLKVKPRTTRKQHLG